MPSRAAFSSVAATLLASAALADEAHVLDVDVACQGEVCRFDATIRHADEGWEHYADRFEVLSPEGEVLGTRVLRHPHVEEQPFTRRLAGVRIPASITRVQVRAGDSVHGFGGQVVELSLPGRSGGGE